MFTEKYIKIRRSSTRITRNQKRKAMIEHSRFIEKIEPMEVSFTENVLNDNMIIPYEEMYKLFLETIAIEIDEMNKHSFKIIWIDPYYFAKAYKPINDSNDKSYYKHSRLSFGSISDYLRSSVFAKQKG